MLYINWIIAPTHLTRGFIPPPYGKIPVETVSVLTGASLALPDNDPPSLCGNSISYIRWILESADNFELSAEGFSENTKTAMC